MDGGDAQHHGGASFANADDRLENVPPARRDAWCGPTAAVDRFGQHRLYDRGRVLDTPDRTGARGVERPVGPRMDQVDGPLGLLGPDFPALVGAICMALATMPGASADQPRTGADSDH
jgi:hypothetical protein